MDTKAIEEYSKWARRELIERVGDRLYALGLSEKNRIPADATVIGDRVLTDEERAQRAELIERIDTEGEQAFVERMAYTWFNRLAAIRYMEVHDFLPSRTRILSGEDGSTNSQALKEITSLDLPALDTRRALDLALRGTKDDELFNMVLLAQCDQLADCMPAVFEHLGAADALTLPVRLYTDKDGVVARLVNDIPESAWSDVEILGWMYQFYVSERKDEAFNGFKKGKKASKDDIGPATQLFTPDWIVRYMVENSLGRLWMLNNPTSQMRVQMKYYIEPEGQAEDFIKIDSPEDISFCDPACGSGHILVYAFDLLWQMYEECGYGTSEIATLILTKNLHGTEIDSRAAQYAVLQLTMKAREHDRRFLSRGVVPDICVLEPVAFEEDERMLLGRLAQKAALLDALEHLTECGSLLKPEVDDIAAIREALDSLSDNLAGEALRPRLESALASCGSLTRTFDVVVANPPYMGSDNFNAWTNAWTKKNYPDEKKNLCACFIERGFGLVRPNGYVSMVTMQSWMFLSSFEKMRGEIIGTRTILSMCHLGARAFDAIGGEVVATTATTFLANKNCIQGDYVRLVDLIGSDIKRDAYLEAIVNHECGWFYRVDADLFKDIPGNSIAYWASEAVCSAFNKGLLLGKMAWFVQGLKCGDTDRFVRNWYEVSFLRIWTAEEVPLSDDCETFVWYPLSDGGLYSKWYGNRNNVINWLNNGEAIKNNLNSFGKCRARVQNSKFYFKDNLTWSALTSGPINARLSPKGTICAGAGYCIHCKNNPEYILGLINSSVLTCLKKMLSCSMNNEVGDLIKIPYLAMDDAISDNIRIIVTNSIEICRTDWDSKEHSWCFAHHPML